MKVKYTYKFRLYPNKQQKILLNKHFGCTRFVYNYFLTKRQEDYEKTGKSTNYNQDSKNLTKLKKEFVWLNEVGCDSLQQSLMNLNNAYKRFFNKISNKPKFKNKNDKQAFKSVQQPKIKNDKLVILKFREGIKIKLHQEVKEKIRSCTITKNKSNQYYCLLLVNKEIQPLKPNNNDIGIDLGIKSLITNSNGNKEENTKSLKKLERKIKRIQRKLSKRRNKSTNKKSKRIEKVRLKLAKLHQRVKNIRHDKLHKITRKIINENQVVYAETLAIKNMLKNHKLAKAISDCSWGELIRQLRYKSEWYGREFIQIDQFYPSSKTCNECEFINKDLKLSDREWICSNCGCCHDRDINAAINILKQGRRVRADRSELKLVDSEIILLSNQRAEDETRNFTKE